MIGTEGLHSNSVQIFNVIKTFLSATRGFSILLLYFSARQKHRNYTFKERKMDPFNPIWSKLHEYYKNMTIFISFDLNLFLGSLRVELLTWHWKWDSSIEITWFVAILFILRLRLISQKLSPSTVLYYQWTRLMFLWRQSPGLDPDIYIAPAYPHC